MEAQQLDSELNEATFSEEKLEVRRPQTSSFPERKLQKKLHTGRQLLRGMIGGAITGCTGAVLSLSASRVFIAGAIGLTEYDLMVIGVLAGTILATGIGAYFSLRAIPGAFAGAIVGFVSGIAALSLEESHGTFLALIEGILLGSALGAFIGPRLYWEPEGKENPQLSDDSDANKMGAHRNRRSE